jgi:CheY-like chemotaxis protein
MISEKFHLLVAEDDVNDRRLLDQLLGWAGLSHIVYVEAGDAAIAYLAGKAPYRDRKAYPYPDILLLDLGLPKVSGQEVLDWIAARPKLPRLSIYIVSGSPEIRSHRPGVARQIRGYFQKPLTLAQVTWMLEDQIAASS